MILKQDYQRIPPKERASIEGIMSGRVKAEFNIRSIDDGSDPEDGNWLHCFYSLLNIDVFSPSI